MLRLRGGSPLGELLGDSFLAKKGEPADLNAVVGDSDLVAIYFSAHWCGPCRGFTPKLKAFYEMLGEEGKKLPIVFASSDQDEAAFLDYFAEMPWHAFAFNDAKIKELNKKYEVSGIPWLVVLNAKTGALVHNEADTVVGQGTPAYDKWLAVAVAQAA